MWIFTTSGFLSAVSKETDTLSVRARDRQSLVSLSAWSKSEIISTPYADYPYRIETDHQIFSSWVAREAVSIDYNNFKTSVGISRGKKFARSLASIWSTMHEVEDSKARMS
jgi:hypothetical protein